jgi:hypothetical protein
VHPPEFSRPEPVPKIEPPRHVEAGQTNHDDSDPRLPDEAVLDRLERLEQLSAKSPRRTAGNTTVVAIDVPPIQAVGSPRARRGANTSAAWILLASR